MLHKNFPNIKKIIHYVILYQISTLKIIFETTWNYLLLFGLNLKYQNFVQISNIFPVFFEITKIDFHFHSRQMEKKFTKLLLKNISKAEFFNSLLIFNVNGQLEGCNST